MWCRVLGLVNNGGYATTTVLALVHRTASCQSELSSVEEREVECGVRELALAFMVMRTASDQKRYWWRGDAGGKKASWLTGNNIHDRLPRMKDKA